MRRVGGAADFPFTAERKARLERARRLHALVAAAFGDGVTRRLEAYVAAGSRDQVEALLIAGFRIDAAHAPPPADEGGGGLLLLAASAGTVAVAPARWLFA